MLKHDMEVIRMNRPTDLDKLPHILCVDDIASAFGVGRNTAYELMNKPNFPSKKIGRKWFVLRDSLIEWMSDKGNTVA